MLFIFLITAQWQGRGCWIKKEQYSFFPIILKYKIQWDKTGSAICGQEIKLGLPDHSDYAVYQSFPTMATLRYMDLKFPKWLGNSES